MSAGRQDKAAARRTVQAWVKAHRGEQLATVGPLALFADRVTICPARPRVLLARDVEAVSGRQGAGVRRGTRGSRADRGGDVTRFNLPRRDPVDLTAEERQALDDAEHDAAVQLLIDALAGERAGEEM